MNIAKENFIAYEQVRIKVQADMHDLKQVAAKASLPRSVVQDITLNYNDYMEQYCLEGYIKRIIPSTKRTVCRVEHFHRPYRDLVAILGEPTVDIWGDTLNVVWSLPTPYGFVAIYTPSHSKLLSNRLTRRFFPMWYIKAENTLANEVIVQRFFAYDLQKMFMKQTR